MSDGSLDATLDLLGRVLALEKKQGYRNRAATGGLYRFFRDRFEALEYDADTWRFVDGLLAAMKRYEGADSAEQRHVQAEILLRRAAERSVGGGTYAAPATGPVSGEHAGNAADLARLRVARLVDGDARRHDVPERVTAPPSAAVRPRATAGAPALPPAASEPRRAEKRAAPAITAVSLDEALTPPLRIRAPEAQRLARLGVVSWEDAIYYFPRAHYDCRHPVLLHKLRPGMTTTIIGTLQQIGMRRTGPKTALVEAKVADETAVVRVNWFGQYMAAILRPRVGQRIAISGHTTLLGGRMLFVPRDYEFPDDDDLTHTGRLVPIYPLTEGLTQRWVRGTIKKALDAGLALIVDPLPEWLLREWDLRPLREALFGYHFPADEADKAGAVRRLAFDDLLYLSLGMARRKRDAALGPPGQPIPRDAAVEGDFTRHLPFQLTAAQRRAIDEVLGDMARPTPMGRLLQGDVGSGKTVVAALALLMAARAGHQGAIMAPTEILAEQHRRSLEQLLAPFGVTIALLTGSLTVSERRRVRAAVAAGEIAVVAGTHALIQEGVEFKSLALAVVDEQHRFGVTQRATLRQKGLRPHVLAMTATPIPRTLQLTIFGDLDVSVIDERPPGRQPVETRWEPAEQAAFRLVREQVGLGRQAFVICPLVEEQAPDDGSADMAPGMRSPATRAAVAECKRLQKEVFADLTVGLLHGQMRPADKEATLARFRDGGIDVLVATSVVEVGIDVPNATVMVIEEAQRFGLAQLHQLRGRVGRGAERSYCILLSGGASSVSQQRLQAITSTDDGFELAAIDLELRGPGEFLGTRQSGLPTLKTASLGDMRTIEAARVAAGRLLEIDPHLSSPDHAALRARVERFWSRENERS